MKPPNAQPSVERVLVGDLDEQFARLHSKACELVRSVSAASLDGQRESPQLRPVDSLRENILRSAAVIEQTFGGITASLWDDPFEWTLPETLDTPPRVIEYLEEVEATRRRAFSSLANDSELSREIVVPSGQSRALIDVLRETISRAISYQHRALELRDLLQPESKEKTHG